MNQLRPGRNISSWLLPCLLLSGLVCCGINKPALGQAVIIYLKSGEVAHGDLISVSIDKITFDPVGDVNFRLINISQLDSIITEEEPPTRIYPAVLPGAPPVHLQPHSKRSSILLKNKDSYYYFALFFGYRQPVNLLKLNMADSTGASYPPLVMKMSSGSGGGGSFGALFPLSDNNIALGVDMEITFMNADWYGITPDYSFSFDGSMFILDGSLSLKIPAGKIQSSAFFLTPSLGGGLRRITADADSAKIEETHEAFFAALMFEWNFAGSVSLTVKGKLWNSQLQDLPGLDVPRYTALEFQTGLAFYIE
jgi:hypothetical protein